MKVGKRTGQETNVQLDSLHILAEGEGKLKPPKELDTPEVWVLPGRIPATQRTKFESSGVSLR